MNILNKMLMGAGSVAIGGHARPDGDCVGSCLGLCQYIRENCKDKRVDVYLEEIPESFQFIEAAKEIRHEIPEEQTVYDLFICLDCGDKDRLEFSIPLFDAAKHTLCVDHHISNENFAEENYVVPDASSTSELVFKLMDVDKISKSTAEALYLGIVHDTGVFQFSCVSPSTFQAAAVLLSKGVNAPKLIQETFYEKTYAQNHILGRALVESILFMDGACIVLCIRKKYMEFYNLTPKDLDGIVNQLRNTKGVEVAIFMYELEQNLYKVSLRSGDRVDVNKVAQYFGGGGHNKAAGVTMNGTSYDVINNLASRIELQLRGTV